MIRFTEHAFTKILLLKNSGFHISQVFVEKVIQNPEFITNEKFGRKAAYLSIDEKLAIRIIYEEREDIIVVTVMIVRKERYEKDHI
jgi:hypothetical protein